MHDIDFEQHPDNHRVACVDIFNEEKASFPEIEDQIVHAVQSHGFGLCCDAEPAHQMEKVRDFYCRMLGLPICAEWETGFLLDAPAGKVEFFTNAQEDLPKGTIRHFAFEVDDVDAYIRLCKENNLEIFMGPKDVVLGDIKARVTV